MGLWGGCIIGFITEYYTSHSYKPVREVAQSTETGAATNIIMGLALGYQSAIIPAFVIALIVFVAFSEIGMFGIALSSLGMLSTLATCLSIDVFGPVCDNAGGIAEMAGCHESVRTRHEFESVDFFFERMFIFDRSLTLNVIEMCRLSKKKFNNRYVPRPTPSMLLETPLPRSVRVSQSDLLPSSPSHCSVLSPHERHGSSLLV